MMILHWPMRPLTRRIVDDLGDFAGITWPQIGVAALALDVAVSANTETPMAFTVSAIVASVNAVFLYLRRLQPEPVTGRDGLADGVAGFWSGVIFWTAVFTAPKARLGSVDEFAIALFWGVMAWGRTGRDRGRPATVRAWRAVRQIAARPAVEVTP